MRSWQSDRGLRRLVGEHRAGILNRRQFLARLGASREHAYERSHSLFRISLIFSLYTSSVTRPFS